LYGKTIYYHVANKKFWASGNSGERGNWAPILKMAKWQTLNVRHFELQKKLEKISTTHSS